MLILNADTALDFAQELCRKYLPTPDWHRTPAEADRVEACWGIHRAVDNALMHPELEVEPEPLMIGMCQHGYKQAIREIEQARREQLRPAGVGTGRADHGRHLAGC